MTNALQVFRYKDKQVRTVEHDGEVWFVAKDVCDILELENVSKAVSALDDDEKMTLTNSEGHSGQRGGAQSYNVINEPGLYKLAFKSRKPEAKNFTRWVTHDVLPTIRKTGSYTIPGAEQAQEPLNVRVRVAELLQRLALQVSDEADREHINRESYKYATGEDLPVKSPKAKPNPTPRYWTAQQVGELLKWPTDAVMHRAENLGIMKKPANGLWDGDVWYFSQEGHRRFLWLVAEGIVKIEGGYEYYENGNKHIHWRYDADEARP